MEEGERIKDALVKAMFASLVDEAIYEVAVAAHKIQLKQNGPCAACGQDCSIQPAPGSSSSTSAIPGFVQIPGQAKSLSTDVSRAPSPGVGAKDKLDNPLYECLVCSRQIAASRYAPHLSSCLGLTGAGGTRRGVRKAALKPGAKLDSDRGSASPYVSSDSEASAMGSGSKVGGKPKNGLAKAKANNKRVASPVGKITKKLKTSTPPPSSLSQSILPKSTEMGRSQSSPTSPTQMQKAPPGASNDKMFNKPSSASNSVIGSKSKAKPKTNGFSAKPSSADSSVARKSLPPQTSLSGAPTTGLSSSPDSGSSDESVSDAESDDSEALSENDGESIVQIGGAKPRGGVRSGSGKGESGNAENGGSPGYLMDISDDESSGDNL